MCHCADCKGERFFSQSTARRHEQDNPAFTDESEASSSAEELNRDEEDDDFQPLIMSQENNNTDDEEQTYSDFDDEDLELDANEIFSLQLLDMVASKQITQVGCDHLLKILKQYNENEHTNPDSLYQHRSTC